MGSYRLIIFDGDDTLWHSEELYDRARDRAAVVVAQSGLDPEQWTILQKEIDIANFQIFGLSPRRFPISSGMAYEQLAERAGHEVNASVAELVVSESQAVFDSPARLVDGVAEVLRFTSDQAKTVLLTKGDREVQEKRVADSGLAEYFDQIRIVDAKSSETFADIATSFDIEASACLSVGNSLPSDIGPAIEAGMEAVWIDAHVWGHERRQSSTSPGEFHTLERLDLLPSFLDDGNSSILRGRDAEGRPDISDSTEEG